MQLYELLSIKGVKMILELNFPGENVNVPDPWISNGFELFSAC
jgi:hypothetical protein